MTERVRNSTTDHAIALLIHYSFDLAGYSADQLVTQWAYEYNARWVRSAVIEALYQGRYKAVSVKQILNFWARRGQPLCHFSHEFERIICSSSPQNLTKYTAAELSAPLSSSLSSERSPKPRIQPANLPTTAWARPEPEVSLSSNPVLPAEPPQIQPLKVPQLLSDTSLSKLESLTEEIQAASKPDLAPSIESEEGTGVEMEDLSLPAQSIREDPVLEQVESSLPIPPLLVETVATELAASPIDVTDQTESLFEKDTFSETAEPTRDLPQSPAEQLEDVPVVSTELLINEIDVPTASVSETQPESLSNSKAIVETSSTIPEPLEPAKSQGSSQENLGRSQASQHPIHQFVPETEPSDFYTKLKAVAQGVESEN